MTAGDALKDAMEVLRRSAVAEPRLTAEVLLLHALGRERAWLYAHPEHELDEGARVTFGRFLAERLAGAPTQYITKTQEFYGRPFWVTPDVLIPRPETEHSIERALAWKPRPRRVLDIGTGSGAIAVTLALELDAAVAATDISHAALRVARENARRLGARVEFVCCDLAAGLAGGFDLIVSNPPYVPAGEIDALQREIREFEPRVALDGGESGIEPYGRIVADAGRLLRPGGGIVFEIGYRGAEGVCALLGEGWEEVEVGYDLAGLPRVVSARRSVG
jgi:release factor glutamine methyltransferase